MDAFSLQNCGATFQPQHANTKRVTSHWGLGCHGIGLPRIVEVSALEIWATQAWGFHSWTSSDLLGKSGAWSTWIGLPKQWLNQQAWRSNLQIWRSNQQTRWFKQKTYWSFWFNQQTLCLKVIQLLTRFLAMSQSHGSAPRGTMGFGRWFFVYHPCKTLGRTEIGNFQEWSIS